MKILITGANGFVARNLIKGMADHDVTAITRADVDLVDREAVDALFADKYFDLVIHTAINGGSRLNPIEGPSVFMENMRMHYNLMSNEQSYGRFISFGSGAELAADTPYGLSKHFIRESMQTKPKCVNVRIFAVFGEDELDTRFIKSNIKRYLDHEDMKIHQDKQMDFFYMDDLVSLVRWVAELDQLLFNEIECSYTEQLTLQQIATVINELGNYKVGIEIEQSGTAKPYGGMHIPMPFPLVGLEGGIKRVYAYLKSQAL